MKERASRALLSRSHRQLWRLAATNIIGIYSSDLSGRIYEANDYVLDLLRYTREDLQKGLLTWTAITPPEFLHLDYAAIEVVNRKGSSPVYEKEYIRKDGSRVPILIGFAEIERTTGQYICFIIDQTERMRVLRKVQESEENFRATFEQAAVGVAHVAPDGTWLRTNRKLREILRYDEDSLPGRVQDLVCRDDVPAILEGTRALYAGTGVPFTIETRCTRADGSGVWLSMTFSLLYEDSGRPTYHVIILQDITERRELQDSLQKALHAAEEGTRAKSAFLANMSHELRTPLAGVLGMIELVLDMSIGNEERRLLDVAAASGKSMLRLVSDLLDFSCVEAGSMKFEPADFEIGRCVMSAVDVVAVAAKKKDIDVSVNIASSVPRSIHGDEGRLRQVLVNLLGNAVKFTEKGQVAVTVAAEAEGNLLFCVRDTGIGIPANKINRLFRVFSQADSSSTRRYGGTGLGLALSKQIVERMGGRIWVESEEGEGSRFCFTIPVNRTETSSGDPDRHR